MLQCQLGGMEIHPRRRRAAVKRVPENGEPLLRRMDPDLMRPPGHRLSLDLCIRTRIAQPSTAFRLWTLDFGLWTSPSYSRLSNDPEARLCCLATCVHGPAHVSIPSPHQCALNHDLRS